jgi:hypothetical protein
MNFNDTITDLSAPWKEHQEKSQAKETSSSSLGSESLPTSWNRDHLNLELAKILNIPPLSSALMRYYTSVNMENFSHAITFRSNLPNLRALSINSPAFKDALLFLNVHMKTTLDIKLSRMLLHHRIALAQSKMTNIPTNLLSACQFIRDHNEANIFKKKIKQTTCHTFPHRLHEIISNSEYSDYITWLPNGCAWKIIDRKQFEAVVIPHHFRHERFTSFMRQVRMTLNTFITSLPVEISNFVDKFIGQWMGLQTHDRRC